MTDTSDLPRLSAATDTDVLAPRARPVTARRPLPRAAPARLTITLCVITYAVLAVVAYLPVGPLASRALPVGPANSPAEADPTQMTWFLSWLPYALTHGQSLFHTNFIDYPNGVNLADNTSVPLLGMLGWPVTATLGPVAAFNLLVRLSFALSATSMFFVLRRWCRSWQAPFLAGLLYAFGPYMAAQNLHLDLIFIPLLPPLVLLGDELVRRQQIPAVVCGLLLGLVGGLQYLVSPDVFSGCCVLGIIAATGLMIAFRHQVRSRIGYVASAAPFALLGLGLLTGYPILQLLAGPGHLTGPVIPAGSLQRVQADLLGPIVPTSNQLVGTGFIARFGDSFTLGNLSENGSYLGIPLLVLLVVFVRRLCDDATVVTFAGLAAAGFLLSLGPSLVIGTWASPVPMPELVFAHLPLLQNTIPVRYSLYVLLFAAMILGIGLDRLLTPRRPARTGPKPGAPPRSAGAWSPRTRIAAVGAVIVISLLPALPIRSGGLPWPAWLPGAIERAVPPGTVVVTYPFETPLATQAMAWQAVDNMEFRLMGGYANIAVPGERVGRRWPWLMRPPSVQEWLGYTPTGDRYPPPPPLDPAVEAQLSQFLNRYSVGAVVAWTGGGGVGTTPAQRSAGDQYLRRALGAPRVTGPSFAVWVRPRGGWRAASPSVGRHSRS